MAFRFGQIVPPPPPAGSVSSQAPLFLDVHTLLESSHPNPQIAWVRYGSGLMLLVVLGSAYISGRGSDVAGPVEILASIIMVGLVIAMAIISQSVVRGQRAEHAQLESIEELVQLRRWSEAALLVQAMLSQPTRTPWGRIQALIYLSGILARYHRFDDAIAVQDYLLENVNMDGATLHALRLGRAMAMLREDHLFDADRAINELRRQAFRAAEVGSREMETKSADASADASADETAGDDNVPGHKSPARVPDAFVPSLEVSLQPILTGQSRPPRQHESAGLALVEIYRDVKTGHPAEAEATFRGKLPILRQQLGHRVADAYILAARAYDLMGQTDLAVSMYQKATLLAPLSELQRRYPEVIPLAGRYAPTPAPQP